MVKILVAALILIFNFSLANAACPANIPAGVNCGPLSTSVFTPTGGTQGNDLADQFGKFPPVLAWNFGTFTFDNAYNGSEAAANRTALQAAINYAIANSRQVVNLPCGTSTSASLWFDQTVFADKTTNFKAVTGTANNGSGLIRITVSSTSTWSTGNLVQVFSVGGTTEANGQWTITVIDGTHIDLQGSTFTNAFTSGGSVYNPVNGNFSIWLHGCGGINTNINTGTNLNFVSGLNAPYIIYGPGRGLGGDGFTVSGTGTVACNAMYPLQSVGVAYAAGGSVFEFDRVSVGNAYTVFAAGYGGNSLADHVTFNDVLLSNGYSAFQTAGGEPFILNLSNSSLQDANIIVNDSQGDPLYVRGGSYASGGTHANAFGITSTGNLTKVSTNFQIATTVTSPDTQIQDNCYTAFAIKTADFGPVPFTLVSYSSGTITLQILSSWVANNFAGLDLTAVTNLSNELKNATELYAVEKYTVFCGAVSAQDVHVEGDVPLTLWDTLACPSSRPVRLARMDLNLDPSDGGGASNLNKNNAGEARFLVAQTHPFLSFGNTNHTFEDFDAEENNNPTDPFIIDVGSQGFARCDFNKLLVPLNMVVRWYTSTPNDSFESYPSNRYKGACTFDRNYFSMQNNSLNSGNNFSLSYQLQGDNDGPFKGFRPAPWTIPELTPNQFSQVSAVGTLGTYPLIYGGTIYSVQKNADTSARKFVTSAHQFYSWGQALTYPWSYLGASNCVYIGVAVTGAVSDGGLIKLTVSGTSALATGQKMTVSGVTGTTEANGFWTITVIDGTHIDLQSSTFTNSYVSGGFASDTSTMFAGLAITLNLSGIGNTQFVVTGVYPHLGLVTVTYPGTISTGNQGVVVSPGVDTTVYTGTTIGQQAYSWTSVTLQ